MARVLAIAHSLCGYGPAETAAIGRGLSPVAVKVFLSGRDGRVAERGEPDMDTDPGKFLGGYRSLERFVLSGFQSLDGDRQQAVLAALAAAMDGIVTPDGEIVDLGEGGRAALADRIDRVRIFFPGGAVLLDDLLPSHDGDLRDPDGAPEDPFGSFSRRHM